ncbi:FtsH protease activity modulator HflK [Carboxylicivirga sp. A043]|uniref:FtsH protease activity modulator HflK n=1 Tax=Carboxylicivirga litoralis TaxID=2816963 RepID=UPI0021CB954F|nr:FtsH protease activity modulator HflK [Carboxylicivirga sp. A043]MCU4158286.1 FtsH protease activity modulator HflK [Carboxylicivirga sp. A043]
MKNVLNINMVKSPLLKKLLKYRKIIIILFFSLLIAFSAFFQIDPEEVGVITRFGKYVKKVEPGLNMKIPFIEQVYKVPVERQQKLEFGFRTVKAGINTQYTRSGTKDESLMLTGDLNLADVEWVVQYRINDAYNYLFKVRDPENSLRDVSEAALRQIVGDRTVNEVLTVGRTEIATNMVELMNQICKDYSLGIKIDQVVLQDVNPPEPVKAAFNAVNQAQQEKETLINQAKSEYNKVIPKASGQAKETIQKAEGYATERVNIALGEVARFNAIYSEYVKAPEVTRRRIYLETMGSVLPKLGNKIIIDEQGNNVLPLLQMQLNK